MDEFDKEANEAHKCEANGGGECDLLEFLAVRLGALFDQAVGVLHELFTWLNVLVDVVHFIVYWSVLI